MKYTWEEHDIFAGREVSAYNRTEKSIIGYDPTIHSSENQAYALISLSDGMIVTKGISIKELTIFLNDGGYRPNTIEDDIAKPRN